MPTSSTLPSRIDVVMPGMNGIELALAVSEKFPECRDCSFRVKRLPLSYWIGLKSKVVISHFFPNPFILRTC